MDDFDDKNHEEIEDILTLEEEQKIEAIQIATFIPSSKKEEPKHDTSIWSVLTSVFTGEVFNENIKPTHIAATTGTQIAHPKFDIAKFLYLDKSVIINNISGKNAFVILSPNPIKTVNSIAVNAGAGGIEAGVDISFDNKGDYQSQKISIANNSSSKCCLDNTQFRCTLFLNIDGIWKKSWENRRFDGRKYNINILEKHVEAALNKEDIPNF